MTLSLGWFSHLRLATAAAWQVVVIAALATALIGTLSRRLFTPLKTDPFSSAMPKVIPAPEELETGLLLLFSTYALLEITGGGDSPIYPLAYVLVAFLASFHRFAVGVPFVCVALVLEWMRVVRGGDWSLALVRSAFIAFFATMHLVFLHAEVFRARRQHRRRLAEEIRAMREDARDFRLISSMLGADSKQSDAKATSEGLARHEEVDKLARGAVETIHEALLHTLELVQEALDLRTCVLLWLDESGEQLKLKELVTTSDLIRATSIPASAGAPGAIVKDCIRLSLLAPKPGYLPYYEGPEEIGAFLGIPVVEDGHLRGILCADRVEPKAFAVAEEDLVQSASRQVLRILQSERVFAAVERSKYEMERFFAASATLNKALTLVQVCDAAMDAAASVCNFEFSAVTLYREAERRHTIVRARGESLSELEGKAFAVGTSLVSMVVKNQHYLPAGGHLRDRDVPIFGGHCSKKSPHCESVLVLPLQSAGETLGTFVLGTSERAAYSSNARELLGVIANHVAVSVQNACRYEQMEQLATTDGLTGLVNHRTFQERTSIMLERTIRHGKRSVLILTDIDHFKKVNDSYGHPTGDVVLREVAAVLAKSVRKIDIVARYGGEEFAIVLDETDAKEARKLAERIRLEVKEQVFPSDKGSFKVTLSLGLAIFPDDGRDKQALIAHADQALYAAKHGGRDRVMAYEEVTRSKTAAA